jgi:beta-glucosidase/6-phospho-beta-glucosidase/beta-galactosidase
LNRVGRGESIWDKVIHHKPEIIAHKFNADDSVLSYYHYERDVEMLKELGVDFYRFSISWPRILPDGKTSRINPIGVDYYNKLINKLLENGIEPMVTMYHWDLPQVLEDEGGFLNATFPFIFEDYARLLFDLFGDRVKLRMYNTFK